MTKSRIPIIQTLNTTIGIAVMHWKVFLVRLWMPLAALFLIELSAHFLGDHWVLWIASVPVYVVLAVTTHRLYLLGPEGVPSNRSLTWGKRETQFLLLLVALGLGAYLSSVILLDLSPILGTISYLPIAYISARLSLVFPATAIDREISFRESWDLSEQQQILVLGVVLGVPILFSGIIRLLEYVLYSLLLGSVVASLAGVFIIGCLSLAYKQLVCEQTGS